MLYLLNFIRVNPNSNIQGISQDIVNTNIINLDNCCNIISQIVITSYIIKAFNINFDNFISIDYYRVIIIIQDLAMAMLMFMVLMEVTLAHILLLPLPQNFNF